MSIPGAPIGGLFVTSGLYPRLAADPRSGCRSAWRAAGESESSQDCWAGVGAATGYAPTTSRCASVREKPRDMSSAMAIVGVRPRPPWQ